MRLLALARPLAFIAVLLPGCILTADVNVGITAGDDADTNQDFGCVPGAEGCPCLPAEFCLPGLVCLDDVCIDPFPGGTSSSGSGTTFGGGAPAGFPCDPLQPECDAGLICAYDGGDVVCSPQAPGWRAPYEACEEVESCVEGTVCLAAAQTPGCDPAAGSGCCVPWCRLGESCPFGTECLPAEAFGIPRDGLGICADGGSPPPGPGTVVVECDPMDPMSCAPSEVCAWTGPGLTCTPAAGNVPVGMGCEAANACEPGAQCVGAEFYADMMGCGGAESGCCAPYCRSEADCMAGGACVPLFAGGEPGVPPGFESLGICSR